jgi:hypothetical protein
MISLRDFCFLKSVPTPRRKASNLRLSGRSERSAFTLPSSR